MPVYNIEPFIAEAIRSVLNQTYHAWEAICVDDGSDDGSLQICQRFALEDERISVFTQRHEGPGATRNHGIALARGKYVYFLDGDDYIDSSLLATCVQAAESHNAQLVQFGGQVLIQDGEWHNPHMYVRSNGYPGVWDGVELYVAQRRAGDYLPQPCTYFSRLDLFDGVVNAFPPTIIHEDEYGTFRTLTTAQRVVCLDETLYTHRYRAGSIMTSRDWIASTRGYFKSYVLVYLDAQDDCNEHDDMWKEAKRLYLHTQSSSCIACFYRTRALQSTFAETVEAQAGDKKALDVLLSYKELNPRFFVARRSLKLMRWHLGMLRNKAMAVFWKRGA